MITSSRRSDNTANYHFRRTPPTPHRSSTPPTPRFITPRSSLSGPAGSQKLALEGSSAELRARTDSGSQGHEWQSVQLKPVPSTPRSAQRAGPEPVTTPSAPGSSPLTPVQATPAPLDGDTDSQAAPPKTVAGPVNSARPSVPRLDLQSSSMTGTQEGAGSLRATGMHSPFEVQTGSSGQPAGAQQPTSAESRGTDGSGRDRAMSARSSTASAHHWGDTDERATKSARRAVEPSPADLARSMGPAGLQGGAAGPAQAGSGAPGLATPATSQRAALANLLAASAGDTPRADEGMGGARHHVRRGSLKRSIEAPEVSVAEPADSGAAEEGAAGSKRSKQGPTQHTRAYVVPQAGHLHGRVSDLRAFFDVGK